jgi:ATP-dependent DNA helicase 2 subunit 2
LQAEKLKLGKDGNEDDVVKEISSVNPIADFTKMINDRKTDRVGDAIMQMQKMIERFVIHSLKGDLFDKALECMKTLREACVNEDEAPSFNKFAERIKGIALKNSNENENFFRLMVDSNLSLITKHESSISSIVEPKEATEFLQFDSVPKTMSAKPNSKKADLIDDIE